MYCVKVPQNTLQLSRKHGFTVFSLFRPATRHQLWNYPASHSFIPLATLTCHRLIITALPIVLFLICFLLKIQFFICFFSNGGVLNCKLFFGVLMKNEETLRARETLSCVWASSLELLWLAHCFLLFLDVTHSFIVIHSMIQSGKRWSNINIIRSPGPSKQCSDSRGRIIWVRFGQYQPEVSVFCKIPRI